MDLQTWVIAFIFPVSRQRNNPNSGKSPQTWRKVASGSRDLADRFHFPFVKATKIIRIPVKVRKHGGKSQVRDQQEEYCREEYRE